MRLFEIFKGKTKIEKKTKESRKLERREEIKEKENDLQRFFKYYNFNSEEERKYASNEFSELLLLNPHLVRYDSKEIAERAEYYANNALDVNNLLSAELEYRFASGIALLEGDVNGLVKYLTRFNEIREKRKKERMFEWILKNPERAVEIAKAFYEWREKIRSETK